MGLNDAVQALKKAEKLKEKVQCCRDLLNDGDAWVWQQQLQRIYQQVLLQDLEYALDCKVEQELWNYGFKNYIGMLQNMVKDRKNPKRSESQAMLTWCLEAASGFYLTLLQEICTAFDLDLSCRRKDSVYGINEGYSVSSNRLIHPNTTSCSYICQHCLVHLGDIARYRNQNRQAESFYRHAVQLSPTSGQPYNQLALLDSSRGDRLGTVFHYVRSVAVRHLFPAAATNLKRMFSKCAEEQFNLEGRTKLTVQEYVAVLLKLHGLLYLSADADLTTCSRSIRLLTDTLTAQVATESFTSRKLVQMLAVNLFALHHARGKLYLPDNEKEKDHLDKETNKLSAEQKQAKGLVLDLMAGSLSALLLPVYTIRDNEALVEYFALPAIKLTFDWIQLEPHVLFDQAFVSRLQIWPSLCKLLNGLQAVTNGDDYSNKYASIPLPEDRELHGFLPLEKAFQDFRFNHDDVKIDSADINRLRASRIVNFGVWLSKREGAVISAREVQVEENGSKNVKVVFEAVASGQAPSSELLRELEQLSLGVGLCPQQPSPSPSDAGSWGGSSTSTPGGAVSPPPLQTVILEHVQPVQVEKKAGILKPQGSLEKSRERELHDPDVSLAGQGRKGMRQNIAMQAILRKGVSLAPETDSKQVSFKTPSPTPSELSENGSTSNQWLSNWTKPQQPQAVTLQESQYMPQHHQQPRMQIPPPAFTQPPPPLQQLQQQAQARVVHIPPLFPLPPMNVPPPRLGMNPKDEGHHVTTNNYVVSDSPVQLRPPFAPWQEDPPIQMPSTENNHRSPTWLPMPADQLQSHNARVPPPSFPMNMYSGVVNVNWSSMPQQQQQQLQQPHSAHHLHQGVFSPSLMYQQQLQRTPSDEKPEVPTSVQGFSPYSLFSTNTWLPPAISPGQGLAHAAAESVKNKRNEPEQASSNDHSRTGTALMGAQSLWSGPGPSPLERLLEQQKQLREGPSPKSGT